MNSALIYVASPLQTISAIEAIIKYKIDFYRLITLDDGTPRQKQIENFLISRNVKFEVLSLEKEIGSILSHFVNLVKISSVRYDYLFIGDYRNIALKMNHLKDLKIGGKIVYLDDGNFVIALFNNRYKINCSTKFNYLISDLFVWIRSVSDYNFFTIFDDVQNSRYCVESNQMTYWSLSNTKCDNTIYIIGTYIPIYCQYLGVSEDVFLKCYIKLVYSIKRRYANKKIVYIPHGRDTTQEIKKISEFLGVQYMILEKCVELYFIENNICPFALYGFGSTALFTLKKIYPVMAVYNVFCGANSKQAMIEYQELNNYYAKHGIVLINDIFLCQNMV